MSVLCRFCGNRVASAGALPGHYRRKHPEHVPAIRTGLRAAQGHEGRQRAGIAQRAATKGLSDAAYVAQMAVMQSVEESSLPVEADAEKPASARFSWWPWALFAAVCFFLALSPDSDSSGHADLGLVSSYQPEGDGQ